MKKASELMSRNVVTIQETASIAEAAKILVETGYNGLPVVNAKDELVGILCQSDLVAQQKKFPIPSVFSLLDSFLPLTSFEDYDAEIKKITALNVKAAMTQKPVSVKEDTAMEEVATLMADAKLYTLPVVDDAGKLIGVIGKEDILKTLFKV